MLGNENMNASHSSNNHMSTTSHIVSCLFVNWKISITQHYKYFQLSWMSKFMSNVQNKSWSYPTTTMRKRWTDSRLKKRQSTLILWIYIFHHVIYLELKFFILVLHNGLKYTLIRKYIIAFNLDTNSGIWRGWINRSNWKKLKKDGKWS